MSFQMLEIVRAVVVTALERKNISTEYYNALVALESAIKAVQKFL